MDFRLFFEPLPFESSQFSNTSFGNHVFINSGLMPECDCMDLAIIGLSEYRGEGYTQGSAASADAIRKELYPLSKGVGKYKIVDLGNLRNGPQWEDTIQRIKVVTEILLNKNITPIFIGGSHDLEWGQYLGYEGMDKMISVLGVDSHFDFKNTDIKSQSHLSKIFKHSPNYLYHYTHLAHQRYFNHPTERSLWNKMTFKAIRLGEIKENIIDIEPTIRGGHMMAFDMCAVKSTHAPGGINSKIFGLSGEEACQLCWFAGHSENMTSLGLYGYDEKKDDADKKTAFVMATMIWYFVEGFYNRMGDHQFLAKNFTAYDVTFDKSPKMIRFLKSKLTAKWWMEFDIENKKKDEKTQIKFIPCDYNDYLTATKGEIPVRWLEVLNKL